MFVRSLFTLRRKDSKMAWLGEGSRAGPAIAAAPPPPVAVPRGAASTHAQNSWHGRDSLSHSRHTSATVHQQQIILPISATFWPEAGRGACGAVRRGFVGSWRGERGSKGACEGQLGAVRGSCQLWAPAIVRIPDSAAGLLEFLSDHQERVSGVGEGGLMAREEGLRD